MSAQPKKGLYVNQYASLKVAKRKRPDGDGPSGETNGSDSDKRIKTEDGAQARYVLPSDIFHHVCLLACLLSKTNRFAWVQGFYRVPKDCRIIEGGQKTGRTSRIAPDKQTNIHPSSVCTQTNMYPLLTATVPHHLPPFASQPLVSLVAVVVEDRTERQPAN